MYVVVRYPKNMKDTPAYGLNVYAKQHSQKDKMIPYLLEQQARHPACVVVLVKKETAELMRRTWASYHRNIGRNITRKYKIKTVEGHINYEEEWEEE